MTEQQSPWMRPPSDPSELTTAQILREAAILRELLEANASGSSLLVDQKFAAVDRQFELVERMRVEQKKDTKDAVDAALTAQKEAVKEQTMAFGLATAKSETAMSEQLKQLNATFTAGINALTNAHNDTKDRVSRIESTRSGGSAVLTTIMSAMAIVISIIMGIFYITHK